MNRSHHLCVVSTACLLAMQSLQAAPLVLAQVPWGMTKAPAPNVIVSVDNSSSMGSEGVAALKAALNATFSTTNVADNKIRLGWQAMHGCNVMPGNGTTIPSICKGYNGVRRFSGTHRTNFNNWVSALAYSTGTPSHWVMDNAGKYLSATGLGINSPWALNPGVTEQPLLACRRSYNIFMTDGEYGHAFHTNRLDMAGPDGVRIQRGGNADGTAMKLPDGVDYSIADDQTRLYRDGWGSSTHSSLSDLAFFYWSRDLQPDIPNKIVPPPGQVTTAQNFGTTANPALLQPYWNPRNNPATWQHMVTYSIGFLDAARWSGNPVWSGSHFTGLAPLANGSVTWPTSFCGANKNTPCDGGTNYLTMGDPRKAELWHMALNSRGQFIPAPDAQTLATAFKAILQDITDQNQQGTVSIAADTDRIQRDRLAFQASYNAEQWSGEVQAYAINGTTNERASTPTWSASTTLDATTLLPTARRIFTHDGTTGIPFLWNSFTTDMKGLLKGADTDTVGSQRLDYIRGDRSREQSKTGGTLRDRASRLGSIVNSNLWVTAAPRRLAKEFNGHEAFRTAMKLRGTSVYVGSNDGMLHGFNAQTGAEQLAYVPAGVIDGLRAYTLPSYGYRAFVDGHPFTGDADVRNKEDSSALPDWRTVLVGALGAGGRGFFVLDVTDPANFSESKVMLDRTLPAQGALHSDARDDLGHIYSAPVTDGPLNQRSQQIVRLNNQRWAAVMGNGVNSRNERPVLLVQYLDGDRRMLTIVADSTSGQSNGLAAPRLIDVNGDGVMDIAYAGDLKGQLWKFNLTSGQDSQWGVTQWDGTGTTCKDLPNCQPFARLTDDRSTPVAQPITTAPMWMPHPQAGIQILIGTGRLMQSADAADTQVQTVYAMWDKSAYITTSSSVSTIDTSPLVAKPIREFLVSQPVTQALTRTDSATGKTIDTGFVESATNTVVYSKTDDLAKRGWYVDLPVGGERTLVDPQVFDGSKIAFVSTAPAPETSEEGCTPEGSPGRHWLNLRDMISGLPYPVFSTLTTTLDLGKVSRVTLNSNEYILLPGLASHKGDELDFKTSGSDCSDSVDFNCKARLRTTAPVRADWREVRR